MRPFGPPEPDPEVPLPRPAAKNPTFLSLPENRPAGASRRASRALPPVPPQEGPGSSPARQAARFPSQSAKRPVLPFLPEKQAHRGFSRPTGRALPPVPPQNRPGEFARPVSRALSLRAANRPVLPFLPEKQARRGFSAQQIARFHLSHRKKGPGIRPPGRLHASPRTPQKDPGIRPSGRPRASTYPAAKQAREFARPASRALSPLAAKRPALPLARRGGPLGVSLALRRAKGRAVFV